LFASFSLTSPIKGYEDNLNWIEPGSALAVLSMTAISTATVSATMVMSSMSSAAVYGHKNGKTAAGYEQHETYYH
jgi:hypothetical protein